MITVTGAWGLTPDETEVFDFEYPNSSCSNLDQLNMDTLDASGGLIDDKIPLVCGGMDLNHDTFDACYLLNETKPILTLDTPRTMASGVTFDNKLYIFGGKDHIGGNYLPDIIQVDPTTKTSKKVADLPMSEYSAGCVVHYEGNKLFLSQGENIWKSNFGNLSHWTQGPSLKKGRNQQICATIPHAKLLVVIGGLCTNCGNSWYAILGKHHLDTVEILQWDAEFEGFTYGPKVRFIKKCTKSLSSILIWLFWDAFQIFIKVRRGFLFSRCPVRF